MCLCNSSLASVSVHCVCDPEIICDKAQDWTQGLNKSADLFVEGLQEYSHPHVSFWKWALLQLRMTSPETSWNFSSPYGAAATLGSQWQLLHTTAAFARHFYLAVLIKCLNHMQEQFWKCEEHQKVFVTVSMSPTYGISAFLGMSCVIWVP